MENGKSAANASQKVVKRETLLDRLDAMIIGLVLALAVVFGANQVPFVANFQLPASAQFAYDHIHSLPLTACAIYVVVVQIHLQTVKSDGSKDEGDSGGGSPVISFLLRMWNLFLAFLSLVMMLGLGIPLVQWGVKHNIKENFCDKDQERWHGGAPFWIYVFILSKYAELIDTVFLIIRKKPVNFLHWYHHTTVLAYSWYAFLGVFSPGWAFALVNSFVHTIMYWYYYRRACGVKLTYDKIITQIQLTQMVVGVVVTSVWAYFHYQDRASCPSRYPDYMIGSAVLMYGSYFYLFAVFYFNRYRANRAAAAANADKSKRA